MTRKFLSTEMSPWRLYLTILGLVFLSEFCVMLILPRLPLQGAPRWIVGVVDAGMLTLVLVPIFWWLVIRPLLEVAALRTRLLEQFIAMQEEERGRVARDLHDEIGQSFTSVLIELRTIDPTVSRQALLQRLEELAVQVTDTLQEVRRLARGLRPAVLDHLGLVRAIEQHLSDFQRTHQIDVELNGNCLDDVNRLAPAVETAVFRIVQESLTNIARHASASRVCITMRKEAHTLHVGIEDNGRGTTPTASSGEKRARLGSGVAGMIERAALLRGKLRVDSRPGKGTLVSLSVPLHQGDDA